MYFFDLGLVIKFWLVVFVIGTLFLPLTTRLLSPLFDKGYIFSKVLGIVITSYVIFILGIAHILPFDTTSVVLLLIVYCVGLIVLFRFRVPRLPDRSLIKIWVFEELLFLGSLLFWCYIKGFQPDINGLEKFMDFGFINSIIRSTYFPPTDMWFPPEAINYYYFGHLITALLTKLSGIESFITYNIMLSLIFAFTLVGSFSIAASMAHRIFKSYVPSIITGLFAGILVSLGGNLHTIYAFFQSYVGEQPVPFWTLPLLPLQSFGVGYWYPNATRFIQNTIHEFPSYSFVVSDLHGHVLDIPIVLFTIALLFVLFTSKSISYRMVLVFSFFPAVMYMTNAWDGIIYSGLFIVMIIAKNYSLRASSRKKRFSLRENLMTLRPVLIKSALQIIVLGLGFIIFTLPFNLYFKPFASGIGFICAPEFLQGKMFGPLLFEEDHCQRSPLYQLLILWGFFYITFLSFIILIVRKKKTLSTNLAVVFSSLLFFFASLLILIPELIYAKDIYPDHYRANTMFKLGYQAFIMLSLISAVAIAALVMYGKRIITIPLFALLTFLVLVYPYFSITSYFGKITPERYIGLNGISYMAATNPDDYAAIMWLNENVEGQPVIAEAQGDSYTNYARISANTGLPTILGWTVHEWLWRGDYSIPEPRIRDVRAFYEDDIATTQRIIDLYNVELAVIGNLEREKYPNLNEEKFRQLGARLFTSGLTTIYQLH